MVIVSRLAPALPVVGQVGGLVAFLVGLFLLTSLPWALLVGGLLVTGWCVAVEATGHPAAPSDRRRGDNGPGVE